MNVFDYEDRLEVLGILAGLFVVVVGLGTLLEPPWTTNEETVAALVQTLGIFLTVGIGLVLIFLSYTGDRTALLPFGDDGTDD